MTERERFMTPDQQVLVNTGFVSYETINDLKTYERLLLSWNDRMNLVAESTLPQVWIRHFLDSAQLFPYIPEEAATVADMGAGAGFPGIVLAIMAKNKKRSFVVHAIESIGKKADFLNAVVEELKLNVRVRRERIEDIKDLKADVLTARALKSLPELLKYANRLTHKDTLCLFLKGKSLSEELTEVKKYWTFKDEIRPSHSDDSGHVLILKNLRYKTGR